MKTVVAFAVCAVVFGFADREPALNTASLLLRQGRVVEARDVFDRWFVAGHSLRGLEPIDRAGVIADLAEIDLALGAPIRAHERLLTIDWSALADDADGAIGARAARLRARIALAMEDPRGARAILDAWLQSNPRPLDESDVGVERALTEYQRLIVMAPLRSSTSEFDAWVAARDELADRIDPYVLADDPEWQRLCLEAVIVEARLASSPELLAVDLERSTGPSVRSWRTARSEARLCIEGSTSRRIDTERFRDVVDDCVAMLADANLRTRADADAIADGMRSAANHVLDLATFAESPVEALELGFELVETLKSVTTTGYSSIARASARDRVRAVRAISRLAEVVAAASPDDGSDTPARAEFMRAFDDAQCALRVANTGDACASWSRASLDAVVAALRPDEALVSFRLFSRTHTIAGASAVLGAFVVRPSAEIEFVEIGPIATLEDLVAEFGVSRGSRSSRGRAIALDAEDISTFDRVGDQIRRYVLDPVLAKCGPIRTLYLSQEHTTFEVPWDALPLADGIRRVCDEVDVAYLGSAAVLLDRRRAPARVERLSAIGDIGDLELGTGGRFASLPGTRAEIEFLATTCAAVGGIETTIATGSAATRAALESMLARGGVVHVATHGFFDDFNGTVEDSASLTQLATSSVGRLAGNTAPACLVGVALAAPVPAATRLRSGLVAESLTVLDLSAVDLLTLSACDTGAGMLRFGRGRESFAASALRSGAKQVLASIWPVDDDAAVELMREFYRQRIQRGRAAREALALAKQSVRERGMSVERWAPWFILGAP